jgi:hypothetical protein
MGPGLRPYVKYDWPSHVFLAGALEGGGIGLIDQQETRDAEDFVIRFKPRGFRLTPLDAIEAYQAQQLEFAKLAAEREYEKRHKLSPKARAEVQQVEDAAGMQHLPTIPETPIKRRGRPKKVTVDG